MKLRVRKHDVQINNRALGNRIDALYVALNRTDPSGNALRSTVQNEPRQQVHHSVCSRLTAE